MNPKPHGEPRVFPIGTQNPSPKPLNLKAREDPKQIHINEQTS